MWRVIGMDVKGNWWMWRIEHQRDSPLRLFREDEARHHANELNQHNIYFQSTMSGQLRYFACSPEEWSAYWGPLDVAKRKASLFG